MNNIIHGAFRFAPAMPMILTLLFAWSVAQAQEAAPTEFTGEASIVVFDDFANDRSEIRYYITEEKSRRERRLFFNDSAPPGLQTGQKVRVRGRGRPDGGIDVDTLAELDGSGGSDAPATDAALAPPETRKVLTLLVDFNDAVVTTGTSNGTTVTAVQNRMYNEAKSVAGLFFNASLGTLTLDPDGDGDGQQDVFHVTIDDSYLGNDPAQCTPSTWVNLASAAWEQANPGKSIGIYRHRLLITPNYWDYGNRHCTWGGVAQVGCGTWCWAVGADPQSIMHGVIVHELGHNLGFNHARTDQNNNGYNSSESTDSEYGDNSDMMGSSRNWKKFNAPHAEDRGWIDPVEYEIREVLPGNSPQLFDLLPLDDEAWDWPGLRALKLERTSNTDYYVTFRRASGDYNNLESVYRDRLAIYYGFDNSTYSYFVRSLAAGERFVDTANDLVITATSAVPLTEGGRSTSVMGVEVCRQDCSATPAPSGLAATALSTSTIGLDWNYTAGGEDGFDIQRSADGSSGWAALTTVSPGSSSYTDTGLLSGTDYFYRVRASSPSGDSGWSNVAGARTIGIPPVAGFSFVSDMLQLDFTDTSTDSDGAIVAWSWNFGDGGSSTERNPSHVYAAAGDYPVSLTVTDEDGYSDSDSQWVEVFAPLWTDHSALDATTVAGTVSGSIAATTADDGVVQAITERESGGKPSSRYSYLEHRWSFNIPAGDTATVMVNAWQTTSTDGDSFDFAWSADGSNWSPLLTVSATADGTPLSFMLPAGTRGNVYIRATDTERSAGGTALDSLYVDYLQIRVTNGPPQPLEGSAPSGLAASAVSHDSITLSWADHTSNEAGFSIERSAAGEAFTVVASTAPNNDPEASYTDTGLNASTIYSYRVRAFKGTETTAYSNTGTATTGPAPAINLAASGYKVKGLQHADLAWSGVGTSAVAIFRDGALLLTTDNDGSHTDPIGAKGSGSYSYQVCETGAAPACSGSVTVQF